MIISHDHPRYQILRATMGSNRYNGAYYYSVEIVNNIIPRVDTARNWITINIPGVGCDNAIVFVHNNKHASHYEWLSEYKNLVLVCGIPETVDMVKHLGKAIYLPLSIDIEAVSKYKREKDKDVAFAGRRTKAQNIPEGVEVVAGLERPQFLYELARFRKAYAVGRVALEALALGAEEILPYDPRFPDVTRWKLMDNSDAAMILQKELDKIDGFQK